MLYHGFDKFGQAAEGAGNNKKLQFGLMRIVNVLPTEEAVFLEVVFKSEAEVCTSVFTLREFYPKHWKSMENGLIIN